MPMKPKRPASSFFRIMALIVKNGYPIIVSTMASRGLILITRLPTPLRVQKYGQRQFGARAESHFLGRKSSLDRVVYSLLRSKDSGLIRELYLQVREGEANFADLAAEHAEGPERATRGIVGPVPLSQGHPALVDRLASAQPGLVLEPFQIEDWWVLIRLERYDPATYGPEAAGAMVQELLEHWLEDQVNLRMQALQPLNSPFQG